MDDWEFERKIRTVFCVKCDKKCRAFEYRKSERTFEVCLILIDPELSQTCSLAMFAFESVKDRVEAVGIAVFRI